MIITSKKYVKISFVEHFKFNKRNQQPGESIQNYTKELELLSNSCEFGDFRDTALRDRFLLGLYSSELQEYLLYKANKLAKEVKRYQLSFKDAVLMAQLSNSKMEKKQKHNVEPVLGQINKTILTDRDKRGKCEPVGTFVRGDFDKLNNDKQDGDDKGADSGVIKKDQEKDGKSAKPKDAAPNQRNSNESNRQNFNRPSNRNDPGRSDGIEASKDSSSKRQYNSNRPRSDRDMNNRNDSRNMNQNQHRNGPNRNSERDGQNRNFNNSNNFQNRRRDVLSHSDSDKNYTGGYEKFDDSRKSGRGDGRSHRQQGRGGGGHHDHDNQIAKNIDPKERNYIPPTPTEQEGEISGVNFLQFDEIPVNVSGDNIPPAINTFENSGLVDFVVQNVKRSGYSHPTPIQKNAIPIILAGRDIMACAQTGSGKTAAFLLPIISKLLKEDKPLSGNKPHVLVISPTRELAIQIEAECRKFALKSFLKSLLIYGGTSSGYQMDRATQGCHLLIATPDRLIDFVGRDVVSFEDLRFLVLDEADRMLDMGFLPDIEKLLQQSSMPAPETRQTLMFSATFPEEIQRLAGKFLNTYLFVAVGIVGGASTDVEQSVFEVTKFEKRKKLMEIIDEEKPDGIIVFVETKRNADFLASFCSEKQVSSTSVHSDRYQRQREEALNDFKSGKMKLLIATSVCARGLDIKNVRHVINYDMPKSIDEYVHRIGRTGRVGNCDKAISFFDAEEDCGIAADLKKILHQAGQKVPEFLMDVDVYSSKPYGNNRRGNFGGKDVRKGQYHRKAERGEPDDRNDDHRNIRSDEPVENW